MSCWWANLISYLGLWSVVLISRFFRKLRNIILFFKCIGVGPSNFNFIIAWSWISRVVIVLVITTTVSSVSLILILISILSLSPYSMSWAFRCSRKVIMKVILVSLTRISHISVSFGLFAFVVVITSKKIDLFGLVFIQISIRIGVLFPRFIDIILISCILP